MMVEILCGILGDANYSSNVRRWAFAVPGEDPANLGHCFIAIDPNCFAPGFTDRMSDLNAIHRDLKPSPSAPGPVLVAGDPERINMEQTDKVDGIKEWIKYRLFT